MKSVLTSGMAGAGGLEKPCVEFGAGSEDEAAKDGKVAAGTESISSHSVARNSRIRFWRNIAQ